MQQPRDSWWAPAANRWQKPRRVPLPRETAAVSDLPIAMPSCLNRACAWTRSAHLQARRPPRSRAPPELALRESPLSGVLVNPRASHFSEHASPLYEALSSLNQASPVWQSTLKQVHPAWPGGARATRIDYVPLEHQDT